MESLRHKVRRRDGVRVNIHTKLKLKITKNQKGRLDDINTIIMRRHHRGFMKSSRFTLWNWRLNDISEDAEAGERKEEEPSWSWGRIRKYSWRRGRKRRSCSRRNKNLKQKKEVEVSRRRRRSWRRKTKRRRKKEEAEEEEEEEEEWRKKKQKNVAPKRGPNYVCMYVCMYDICYA